jgi:hypothetical protein
MRRHPCDNKAKKSEKRSTEEKELIMFVKRNGNKRIGLSIPERKKAGKAKRR